MFEKIKHYYEIGLYKQSHLAKLVSVGAISQDEYIEITQEEYDESFLQFLESLSPDEISAEEFMSLLEEVL